MIVDASVVVKWFTTEPLHEEARKLLEIDEPLVAPDILVTEFANALWLKTIREEIDRSAAAQAVSAVSGRGIPSLVASAPYVGRAYELATNLKHPVYDCVYLAVAESMDTTFLTADRRFFVAAGGNSRVRLLESGGI